MSESRAFTMTIGGRSVFGESVAIAIADPATGAAFAEAPGCSQAQLDAAVNAARAAFAGWAAMPFADRTALVAKIAEVIEANLDELKTLLTREQGKPHEVATGELQGAAYWAMSAAGFTDPDEDSGTAERQVRTRRLPLGVVGAIVPWNYPVLTALMKIVPALSAGNTLVLKPAPTTPLATLRLGELLQGLLPDGVLNIVSGGADLGPWMTAHPGFDKITFTGSTAVGKHIMRAAADRVQRFTLELGGNDAAIVLPDVDLEAVARKIFWGALLNSGQICVAAKRVYVHEDIYDRFLEAFVAIVKDTKMGPGDQPGVQLGPIQNKAQFDRVTRLAEEARAAGYRLIQGEAPEGPGYFFPVTLVDNPADDAEIVREEQFGPVLPILKFRDAEDVIARANGTAYGLAGSVWSADVAAAGAIADRLDCGTVWVNTIMDAPADQPLGGHKQSGFGIENGQLGLLEYTSLQTRVTVPAG
ncbi:aldehyde dehydrogenase family protein [Sphingomonas sp. CGMCC 1.13654]|uniref:Aldehyde dehydrogenase family protein n=1 Tax=Sphingomonas chungangi TaxID=2683589 RepID=A0A838L5C9_9SPHN|nr:aldehyde dehydrogenase family protein [Sphingomonas chungangi]MBA2933812.1 aldehyde dehydrogenase family protein [Sphingomonas chungangi]MVW55142.1 aldehyde dehydrogenase family protein [Sphingomonas chungangi]